jgi:tetratricopeptide (TPR) repeat protein
LSNVVATAKHNLGRALMHRGALAEALQIETEAFEEFSAQNDRRLSGAARVYVANILYESGEHPRAQSELEIALATAQPPMRPQILASLARVMLARGNAADALAYAREALETLDVLGGVEEGEALVRLMAIETLAATDQLAAARDAARSAYVRLRERADRITDPAWRARFLDDVPENARTRTLARVYGITE